MVTLKLKTRSNVEVAAPLMSDRNATKILGFLIVCKLYIRMRMRNTSVKK